MCRLFQEEETPYGRIKDVVEYSVSMEVKKVTNSRNEGSERKEAMR